MAKEKFTRCSSCGVGKIMTDELRRGFNAKDSSGKQVCTDCKIDEIYGKWVK